MDFAPDHTPVHLEVQAESGGSAWSSASGQHWGGLTVLLDDALAAAKRRSKRPATIRGADVFAPTALPEARPVRASDATHVDGLKAASPALSSASAAPVSHVANQRVKLLAMKYATERPVPELVARLEIMNARLERLMPRVHPAVKEQLDVDRRELQVIGADIDELLADI